MKITGVHTRVVRIPLPRRIRTTIHDIASVGCVLLELRTDQGLVGESYVFTLNGIRIRVLREAVQGFAHLVEGRDPHCVNGITMSMWDEMNPVGHAGYPVAAMSAIDTACWDLVGKAADLPLHRIFGACRNRIRTYASGGLWLSDPIGVLERDAEDFLSQGFRAMKIRVGSARVEDDIRRVQAVRDVVGPDIELLADANQGLNVGQAVRLGRGLEALGVGWLEEPVSYLDLAGHAAVRSRTTIPVASGETEYTRFGMQRMLEAGAVDILMPDLQRIGGLSEFRRTAAIASVHHVPVSSHLFTEQSLCVAASEPNCMSVEHMPWFGVLFNESMSIRDGSIEVPDRPGLGFTFNQDAVKRYGDS
ncbi:MAG: mandelate racemase/muconate lactonizing enzyme family protein [Gammaproteobacteria bacterium]|nr:mandelate racemase/muconate lactonizing enzyme family protein [Gammaproteobacteria bacterium]MYJ51697.1 mandelate racemase/muconate lactonizing enzyme family protein [Gammaproteobacteria bacterium]